LEINLRVNGERQTWNIRPNEILLDAIRSRGLTGTKRVCESGECGACAVIFNRLAVDSCILLAAQLDGGELTTVEGLEKDGRLHPVQEAFALNGAVQCGFCIPGMVVTAANYLEQNPNPTEEDVRHMFVGNLCRCTGYKKPVEAVLSAAHRLVENT
jgi:aerobic carbon-monoxide dehydrogenase small subunit